MSDNVACSMRLSVIKGFSLELYSLVRQRDTMSEDTDVLRVRILDSVNQTSVIKLLRSFTALPISDIKLALENCDAIDVVKLYGVEHSENEKNIRGLLDKLRKTGISFDIIFEGKNVSMEFFNNRMNSWNETGRDLSMITDLEIGEPCIETLKRLESTSPKKSFLHTINQIIEGDGYKVDNETLEWAKEKINDA